MNEGPGDRIQGWRHDLGNIQAACSAAGFGHALPRRFRSAVLRRMRGLSARQGELARGSGARVGCCRIDLRDGGGVPRETVGRRRGWKGPGTCSESCSTSVDASLSLLRVIGPAMSSFTIALSELAAVCISTAFQSRSGAKHVPRLVTPRGFSSHE